MLEITIPNFELYDEVNNLFVNVKGRTISLEHSLVSLSKWESIWEECLLSALQSDEGLSYQKMLSYIHCMTIGKVDDGIYAGLTEANIKAINRYINAPMTATTFRNQAPPTGRREILTAEVIYYQMVALQIPFECEKWHLNRLLTFIEVCNRKNSPDKKMSKKQIADQNRALNALRRKKFGTRG